MFLHGNFSNLFEIMKQQIIEFIIPAGQSSGQSNLEVLLGNTTQIQVFTTAISNTGIVKLAVLDSSGTPIARPQHINNFRSREANYNANHPLHMKKGENVKLQVTATANFSAPVTVHAIIDYVEDCIPYK